MADLHFASWARTAVGATIGGTDEGGALPPPRIQPVAHLRSSRGATLAAPGPGQAVLAPGDVTGFDTGLVRRADPPDGAVDVEVTMMAAVELDSIELPWLLTPARANGRDRLRPWIVLIVVEHVPLKRSRGQNTVTVDVGELPDLADSWAWAHVQLPSPDATPPPGFEQLVGVTRSRLVCPRRLRPRTSYRACVVPAFAGGRAAGLGEVGAATEDLGPAWDVNVPGEVTLPVYHTWEFSTGEAGDFEQLVDRLVPADVTALPGFAVRPVDVSRPWEHDPLTPEVAPPPVAIEVQGVLRGTTEAFDGPEAHDTIRAFQERLVEHVAAAPARIEGTHDPNGPNGPIPAVTPPVWGGRHAGSTSLDLPGELPLPDLGWLSWLNLDVRQRVAASLGAQYVQANQEQLMAHAWEQVGAIREANQRRAQAEMATEVAATLHRRHVAPLGVGEVMGLAAPAAERVRSAPAGPSLAAEVRVSQLPDAAGTIAFARLLRPKGRLARRAGTNPSSLAERGLPGEVIVPRPGPVITAATLAGTMEPPTEPGAGSGAGPMTTEAAASVTTLAATRASTHLAGLDVLASVAEVNGFGGVATQVRESMATAAEMAGVPTTLLRASSVAELAPQVAPVVAEVAQTLTTVVDALPTDVLADDRVIDQFGVPVRGDDLRDRLVAELAPGERPAQRLDATVQLPPHVRADGPLAPVMAAPRFGVPLALTLAESQPEWFLPGLGSFPMDRALLLRVNPQFVEAFMVGANHEMMSELRWREYPTDLRGTPFARFWPRPGAEDDIPPIDTWTSGLGHNLMLGADGMAVLLLRGTVVRRFPDMVVRAVRAQPGVSPATPVAAPGPDDQRDPLFLMRLDPTTAMYGFAVPPAELEAPATAEAPGWFIVLQENAARLRFGFDAPPDPPPDPGGADFLPTLWQHVDWSYVEHPNRAGFAFAGMELTQPTMEPPGAPGWNSSSADIARIALQRPFRVVMHSTRLVGRPG